VQNASQPLDARAVSKLKWRCRRGLLENDLFIERFFAAHGASLSAQQARGLEALMELTDNDLLDLLLARKQAEGELATAEVRNVLSLMRMPPFRTQRSIAPTEEPR
jgi:antitoxin CptB